MGRMTAVFFLALFTLSARDLSAGELGLEFTGRTPDRIEIVSADGEQISCEKESNGQSSLFICKLDENTIRPLTTLFINMYGDMAIESIPVRGYAFLQPRRVTININLSNRIFDRNYRVNNQFYQEFVNRRGIYSSPTTAGRIADYLIARNYFSRIMDRRDVALAVVLSIWTERYVALVTPLPDAANRIFALDSLLLSEVQMYRHYPPQARVHLPSSDIVTAARLQDWTLWRDILDENRRGSEYFRTQCSLLSSFEIAWREADGRQGEIAVFLRVPPSSFLRARATSAFYSRCERSIQTTDLLAPGIDGHRAQGND